MAPKKNPLDEAIRGLTTQPTARPYGFRVEAACNGFTDDVLRLYGEELGSRSEAIRILIAKGAAALAAERS